MSYCTDNLSASERDAIARDCFQVTEQRGSELHGLCPFHAEKQPSFSYNVDKDLCNCFSCGAGGDLIALWGTAYGCGDNSADFVAFKSKYGPADATPRRTSPGKSGGARADGGQGEPPEVTQFISEDDYNKLQPLDDAWLAKCQAWGWSADVVATLGLRIKPGTPDRLAIPIRQDDGRLVNIRLYAPGDDNKMISWGKGFGKSKLFPAPGQWKKNGVLICEGEKDCITALSKGFNAVTQTAGCNSWADQFTRFFKGRDVVIAYDADEKGEAGAQKVAKKLTGTAKTIRILTWPADIMPTVPDHGQDVTDYFTLHKRTAQDLRDLIAATPVLNAPPTPAEAIPDDVKRFFGGNRGTQFKPRLVADEIVTLRKLIYDPASGIMYTWDETHWGEYQESNLRRIILDMLKTEGTTSRINDVLQMVKDLSVTQHGRKMNDLQDCIPIENGVFDLKTGNLINHDPDHLNTYVVPVTIKMDEALPKCPNWQRFLTDSVVDPDTIRELQKYMGLTLTRETRWEKCLIIIGPGGDGKGTILKINQALVGAHNVANVTLGGLQDQFHRVMLMDKLLNVATEVEAGLLQSDIFKTIVSGEAVTAAYKHRNAFSFVPTCKLAFSANKHPRLQDTSDGLYRRLLIIEMDKQFVKQGKADLYLFDNLIKELPGIFMWALRGLQLLREEGFTLSSQMQRHLSEFQEMNDPLLSFTQEYLEDTPEADDEYVATEDVYKAYVRFCDKGKYRPLSDRVFGKDLKKHCRKLIRKQKTVPDGKKRRWVYANIKLLDDGTF